MARPKHTQTFGGRTPQLGDIVLFHPEKISDGPVTPFTAIIHNISDADPRICDITVLAVGRPVLKQDVPFARKCTPGHWSFHD